MGYNLVIDQGNSAAKLAVFQGDEFVKQWRYDVLDPSRLEEIAALYKPDVAIYCSVACRGEELIVTLRGLCRKDDVAVAPSDYYRIYDSGVARARPHSGCSRGPGHLSRTQCAGGGCRYCGDL